MRNYKSTSLLTMLNLYLFKDDAHLCSMRSFFCVGVEDIYEATCYVVSPLLSVFAHSFVVCFFFSSWHVVHVLTPQSVHFVL